MNVIIIVEVLKILWQLPQVILGAAVMAWFSRGKGRFIFSVYPYHGAVLIQLKATSFSGLCLGPFCFLNSRYPEPEMFHEYGHSLQSLYLGPLYLIVVGIPSLVMNILTRLKVLRYDRYYLHWPENWADSLGHVVRPNPPPQ
jgi:hypothetical protein